MRIQTTPLLPHSHSTGNLRHSPGILGTGGAVT